MYCDSKWPHEKGCILLKVYLVRPESLLTSCSIEQGISDHYAVLLEVEWEDLLSSSSRASSSDAL
jgi:hypothetical protein